MNHFELRGGELHCEDVPLTEIADAVGTPVYVYSTATLERHYQVFRAALIAAGLGEPLIAYAVKANSNVSVLTPAASAASRTSYGGTAPDQVRAQIARWKEILG